MGSLVDFSLSPHKVSFSILIQDFCTSERVPSAARPVLSLFLLENVRQANDHREKTLSELCAALSALQPPLGSALAHQLVQSLRNISSPDALFDKLQNLEFLLQDGSAVDDEIPGLDTSSVLGIFVRKVLLKFHTSMFDGLSDLFTDLQDYVGSFVLTVQGGVAKNEVSVHTELVHFIHHHAGMIETAPPSLHMNQDLDRVLKQMGDPPGGSYLRYLYAVQQGDYNAAVDNLHRYFDYGMFGKALKGEARDRPVFHWALLNLASLHFRFGHMALCLQALEETVRLAQHASDHQCLASALLWLLRLVGVAGERLLEGQLLRRCLQRAAQLRLPKLHSSAVLSLARHRMRDTRRLDNALGKPSGDAGAVGTSPLQVWEALAAALPSVMGGSEHHAPAALSQLKAEVWASFGHPDLALAHSRAAGTLPSARQAADHACLALCSTLCHEAAHHDPRRALRRLLHAWHSFPRAMLPQWSHAACSILLARCLHRAEHHRAQVLVSGMGAMLLPSPEPSTLVAAERARAEVLLRRLPHTPSAHQLVVLLIAASTDMVSDFHFVRWRAGTGDAPRAIGILQRLLELCRARRLPLEGLAVEMSLACAHERAGAQGSALSLALGCMSQAAQLNMDGQAPAAALLLASLHLRRGLPDRALALLRSTLPLILAAGRIEERASAHLLLARAMLGGAAVPGPRGRARPGARQAGREEAALQAAAGHLDKAVQGFAGADAHAEVMESSHLRALVCQRLGRTKERDQAAHDFLSARRRVYSASWLPLAPVSAVCQAQPATFALLAAES